MSDTIFTNRQNELHTLRQELDLAGNQGTRLVLLAAPAGMGKTALCQHFGHTIATEAHFAIGRSWDNRAAAPYHALRQALTPLYRQQQSEGSPSSNPYLETFFANKGSNHQIEALPADLLFHGLAELLDSANAGRPLCVFLDDLQWADESTLQWLDFALCQPLAAPVLWIGAYRSEEAASVAFLLDRSERWARAGRLSELRLYPLEREHLIDLGRQIDANGPWDEQTIEAIHQSSGGLPLLAVEEMRGIVQGQRDLPQGQALIRHKLGRLPEDDRELMRQAAVLGERFSIEPLAVALRMDLLDVTRILDRLANDQFLLVAEEDGFRFAHGRFREALLEGMAPALRRSYHARLTDIGQAQTVTDRAYHLVFSGEIEKGAQALLEEGDRAREQLAWRDAQRYYAEALQLTREQGTDPTLRREAYERMGDLHLAEAEEPEIARGYYEAAMPWAATTRERALLLCRLAETYERSPRALQYLEDAARLMGERNEIRDWVDFRRFTLETGQDVIPGYRQRIYALARKVVHQVDLPHELVARAHKAVFWVGAFLDRAEIEHQAQRLRDLPTHSWSRAELLINLIQAYRVIGEMGKTLACTREAEHIMKTLGRHQVATGLVIEGGFYLIDMGRYKEARQVLLQALDRSPSAQQRLDAHLLLCKTWAYDRDICGLQWARNTLACALSARLEQANINTPISIWAHQFGAVERIFVAEGKQGEFRREVDLLQRQLKEAGYQSDMVWYWAETQTLEELATADDTDQWIETNGHDGADIFTERDELVFRSLPIQGFSHMDMPRALRRLSGNFVLEASIHAGDSVETDTHHCRELVGRGQRATIASGGGGLLVYRDARNALRLFAHTCAPGEVILEARQDEHRDTYGRGFGGNGPLRLRLEKRRDRLSAYVSEVKGHWHLCGKIDLPGWDQVEVGFYGENVVSLYPALVERAETRFSDIRLQAIQTTLIVPAAAETIFDLIEPNSDADFPGIIAHSTPMRQVLKQVRHYAQGTMTALVQGETGTGKELIARALHRLSKRANYPFIALNCAAISSELLERELFGHVRGAFTGAYENRGGLFEAADGGVLFLDEIGEATPAFQARLLRVLEDGAVRRVGAQSECHVDVRVVVATNRNLAELTEVGTFRQDLYYRLCGIIIDLPPLRLRRSDIAPLTAHALSRWAQQRGVVIPAISKEAVGALKLHDWPGNVRELLHQIERAAEEADGQMICSKHLSIATPHTAPPPDTKKNTRAIIEALHQSKGNISAAARHFGISRPTLYRHLRALGIRAADYK